MSFQVTCDVCGHPIHTSTVNSTTPKFQGQTLTLVNNSEHTQNEYHLHMHLQCSERILKIIGAARTEIKASGFKPLQ